MTDAPEHASTKLGLPATTPPKQGLEALVGAVIAERYRIDAPLGEGGMGAVFDGHHLGLDRAIAVKVLHPQFVSDPQVSSRFEREAQAVSRLEHPSIVQVFDVGTAEVPPLAEPISYIVMERLRGHELSDGLGTPLAEPVALDYLGQILEALGHAHARGVVHRDLKPENIFVTRDVTRGVTRDVPRDLAGAPPGQERLKLVDFGIAKMLEPQDGAVLTQLGMVFGTPGYMSPEQCIGAEIDGRSDLYSAGIVFYEMLTGRCPFAAEDMMDVLRMHINVPLPAVPGISDAAAAVLARLAAKKPGDRYAGADEAHEAVMACIASTPASPSNVGAPAESVKAPAVRLQTQVAVPLPTTPQVAGPISPKMWPVGLASLGAVLLMAWMLWPDADEAPPVAAAQETSRSDAVATEEARIDALLEAGDREAAEQGLRSLVELYPASGRLHWRLAEVTGDPQQPSERRARSIGHALRLDPARLKTSEGLAFVMDEARRRTVPDALLDAILAHGDPWTSQWIEVLLKRKHYALPYAQRHRLLTAWAEDEALTGELRRKHRCLDLWQAPDTKAPCATFETALAEMEEHPSADYRRSLSAAPIPDPGTGEAECQALSDRRDALEEKLEGADGDAKYVPADYASQAKAPAKRTRSQRRRPLKKAVKSFFN